jgi:hypothetical protein
VLNREASIAVLEKMLEEHGEGHILTRTMEMGELGPIQKTVTVGSRIAEMRANYHIDKIRMLVLDEMIEKEEPFATKKLETEK